MPIGVVLFLYPKLRKRGKPMEEIKKKKLDEEAEIDENQLETANKPKDGDPQSNKSDNDNKEIKEDTKSEEQKNEAEPKAENSVIEIEKLKAENLRLKTQVSAMGLGIKPDCIEDAVVLAENLVKQGDNSNKAGMDIEAALDVVIKKYPEWKDGKEKLSGFKVGADSSEEKTTSNDKLSSAFGIKKKEG